MENDPLGNIKTIKQNLDDRYKDDWSIIKELIQNADDAGATTLHLGWLNQLTAKMTHPLLQGPIFFALNDGDFNDKDAKAINYFSLSNKSGNELAIGKFGLGLQSIFHWCEAFFCLKIEAKTKISFPQIINPWAEHGKDNYHVNWDNFAASDQNNIQDYLQQILTPKHHFCLWVPLRQLSHLQGKGAIKPNYLGGSPKLFINLHDKSLEVRLVKLLPLLRSLKEIIFWEDTEGKLVHIFRVKLHPAAKRRCFPKISDNEWLNLYGDIGVKMTTQPKAEIYQFNGYEILCQTQTIQDFQNSSDWPELDLDNEGKYQKIKDKIKAHVVVLWMQYLAQEQQSAQLATSVSVFLPVEKPNFEVIQLETKNSFELCLHGYYFIDAGRREVKGWEIDPNSTDKKLEERWNAYLAQYVMFPLILLALDKFVSQTKLPLETITQLTQAFKLTTLYQKYRPYICHDQQWIFVVQSNKWQLLKSTDLVYAIPRLAKESPQRPFEVIPAFQTIQYLTFREVEGLMTATSTASWTPHLAYLLSSIDISTVFSEKTYLTYLVHFLQEYAGILDNVIDQLQAMARQALKSVPLSKLRSYKGEVANFIKLLPPMQRVAFNFDPKGVAREEVDKITNHLLDLPLHHLLFPDEFEPVEAKSSGFLTTEEAKIWLEYAAYHAESIESRYQLALTLFNNLLENGRKEAVLQDCGHWPLFKGEDCQTNQFRLCSWNELQRLIKSNTLFKYANPPTPKEFAPALFQALNSVSIVLVDSNLAKLLELYNITVCNYEACLRVLQQKPDLNLPTQRIDLLQKLLQISNIRQLETQQALRYLLHGYKDKFTDLAPLLIERPEERDNVWVKLTHFVLHQRKTNWQLIDNTLADHLTPEHQRLLKISTINLNNTLMVLQEAKELWHELHTLTFAHEECEILLSQIDNLALLKALPIHEDTQGNIITLTENHIYLQEFPISEGLQQNIRFLAPHPSPSLRAKQANLVPTLTPERAIELALEYSPVDYRVIMDALMHITSLLPDLKETLQIKRWLPLSKGSFVSTGDVIYLPNLENEVARLVTELGGGFIEIGMLLPELRQHGAWPQLCRLLPPQNEALSKLGEMMAKSHEYRLGELINLPVAEFLTAFEGVSPSLLPAYQMLKAVHDHISPEACQQYLWPRLLKAIPTAKSKDLLNLLMQQHQHGHANIKKVHLAYLMAALSHDDFKTILLPQIQLLNIEGVWKPTSQLCPPGRGFADAVSLDREQYKVLRKFLEDDDTILQHSQKRLVVGHKSAGVTDFEASAAILDRYFQAWPKYVNPEVVGGFLSLLGNYEALKKVSEKYLRNRHIDKTYQLVDLPDSNHSFEKVMNQWFFLVKTTSSKETTKTAKSLTSEFFLAPLRAESDLETLLVQSEGLSKTFIHLYEQNIMYYRLEFREIHPQNFESRQLTNLLKQTIQKIAATFYPEAMADFERLFNSLAQSEQLDIKVTQLKLTDAAIFYLQQLRLPHENTHIREILRKWEDLTYQHVEENEKTNPQKWRNQQDIEKEKNKLRNLLLDNNQVQEILIQAVCEKIEQSRYKPQSIPFELFQNADDAYIELAEFPYNPETANRCVVVWDKQKIQFIHWGRPINESHSELVGKNYKNDLTNMLILHFSGKTTAGITTGEFGLGFKTIFFVTHHPKIVSGRLGFEIIGGVYPEVLAKETIQQLRKQFERFGGKAYNGTLFELPLEPGINPQEVMADFEKQINILLVFAQKIKQCDLVKPDKSQKSSWQGYNVLGLSQIQTGRLSGQLSGQTVIVFNLKQGHLLFELDARKVVELNSEIPTIWVTAPTQEKESLGFAVNGKFKLDMGRSQLAKNSADNWNLAKDMGREWGEKLQELFVQTDQQWPKFCQETGFINSPYGFWESLWELLSKHTLNDSSEVKKLLKELVWGSGHGLSYLMTQCAALPTCLWGDYQVLTRLDKVQYQATGTLSKDEPTFLAVTTWPKFREKVPPKTVVSYEVGQVLSQVQPKQLITLNLRWVLNEEIDRTGNVDVTTAQRLGALITVDFMNELGRHDFWEYQDVWGDGSILSKTQFKAQDGKYHPVKELIIILDDDSKDKTDEPLRAAFAPDKHVLDKEYQSEALLFFKACRQRLSVKVETMVEWVFATTAQTKQKAILDYFLSPYQQAREVVGKLVENQSRLHTSWLADLDKLTFFADYTPDQQDLIKILLGLRSPKTSPKPISDPKQKLTEIYDWWQREKSDHIARYEKESYPDFFNNSYFDNSNESWLTLFLLGSFHTIGWTNPQKNRNFLATCYNKGWFNTFANDKATAVEWMDILDNYLNEQIDREVTYLNWMGKFVGIYQISRNLLTYKQAFLESEKMPAHFSLNQITNLKNSWIFSGTDIVGPSIQKTVGIGACFIMRELVRKNVLTSPHCYRHCYVPTNEVREFFKNELDYEIGDNADVKHSATMYEFVKYHLKDKATFDNDFDLAIHYYQQRGYYR